MEYHPHDKRWIAQQLNRLPLDMREPTFDKYVSVFFEVYSAHEGEIAQEGIARRAANNRLREYVDSVTRTGL